jgi:membrane protein YdbS with pleckstrin-like domain
MNEVFKIYDSWFIIVNKLIPISIISLIILLNFEFILFVIFCLLFIIYIIFYRFYYRYKFYEDYIECDIGYWNIKQIRLSYNRISRIDSKQNIILKLLNIGSIKLSDFSKENVIVFRLIPKYEKIKNLISFRISI